MLSFRFGESSHIVEKENINKRTIIDYEYESSSNKISNDNSECKCLNEGLCVLDNDFCVCKPEFTGRYCEINLEKDNFLGCGRMLNNEFEFSKCSKCKCINQILTCNAIATPVCDQHINLKKLTKTALPQLIKLMNKIETDAYSYYIDEYVNKLGFEITYTNIENDQESNFEQSENAQNLHSNTNRIIVFKTSERIVGLYFKNFHVMYSNSSRVLLNYKEIILCLYIFFKICAFF